MGLLHLGAGRDLGDADLPPAAAVSDAGMGGVDHDHLRALGCARLDHGALELGDVVDMDRVGAHGAPPLEEIRKVARPEFSIIFNMEQISSSSALVSEEYQQLISEYRVLDYSQHNVAALLARFPNMRCQEFPLLPKPLFAGDFAVDWAPAEPRPDVAFWGVLNDRRKALLHTLQLQGRSVQLVSRNYGKNLSAAIARTRLCLNVHYYDSAIFELARCLRPLAMGMPIVPKCRACRAWSTGGKAASSSASMTTWPPVAASCWSSRNWRRTRCAKPSTS